MAGHSNQSRILRPAGNVTYEAVKLFDFREFYQTRSGLWVSEHFREHILPFARKVNNLPVQVGELFVIEEQTENFDIRDVDIAAELPEGYDFNVSECLARAGRMIKEMPQQKPGDSFEDRRILFYIIPDSVMYACWNSPLNSCEVGAYQRNDGIWKPGDYILSRTRPSTVRSSDSSPQP